MIGFARLVGLTRAGTLPGQSGSAAPFFRAVAFAAAYFYAFFERKSKAL